MLARPYSLVFESFGLAIEVVSDDRDLFELLPTVLPPGWQPTEAPPSGPRFGLMRAGTITVDGDEMTRTDGDPQATLAALSSLLRHHLAQQAPHHVFIHAGVVRVGGAAVVIPGRTFTGKSTLVAALVRAGATYYSDEYAVVDGQGMIHPYAKPLSMRPLDSGAAAPSAPALDPQAATGPVPAGLILLTRYEPGAEWAPIERGPGVGALGLLEHTIAVRFRPREALAAAAQLTRSARVFVGPRGEASAVAGAVVELAARAEAPPART